MHRKHYPSYENHTSLDSEASPAPFAEPLARETVVCPALILDLDGKQRAEFGRRPREQAAAGVGETGGPSAGKAFPRGLGALGEASHPT